MSAPHRPLGRAAIEVPVARLAGLVLPEDSPVLREHVLPEPNRSADYLARYDRRTLAYDCLHDGTDRLLIVAPRLLNLWPRLRDRLRVGERAAAGLRRRVLPKCELIVLRAPLAPVSVTFGDVRVETMPRPSEAARFAGLRAVMTLSKNNDLDWIADWLRFHVRNHGLDAALFIDNGSDAYGTDALAATIGAVEGLKQAAILCAPYPYGPMLTGRAARVKPNFLQPAMLNLARLGPLSRAAGVLNLDVDELVQGPRGKSVFDALDAAWHGAVNIGGEFLFPDPHRAGAAPQRAHVFRAVPPRVSNRKWAARPKGPLSRMGWFVHQVGGEPFKLVPESREFRLLHCSATSLKWRRSPGQADRPTLRLDTGLQALMDATFDG